MNTPRVQIMQASAPNNQTAYYLGWRKGQSKYYRRYTDKFSLLSDLTYMDSDMVGWEKGGVQFTQMPGYLTLGFINVQTGDQVTNVIEFFRMKPFDANNNVGILANVVIARKSPNGAYALDPDAPIGAFIDAYFI